MGMRQFPPKVAHNDDDEYPLWTHNVPSTVRKRLAGNVIWMQLTANII